MKKKRILSLILAVMMVFLVFTEHTPFSFAEGGSTSDGGTIIDGVITPKAEDIKVTFKNKADSVNEQNINVNVVKDDSTGEDKFSIGSIYPAFTISVDLTRFSYGGPKIGEELKDYGYGSGVPTPENLRLKEGHVLRIPVPKNLDLREDYFGNKPLIYEGEHLATFTRKMAKDIGDGEVGFNKEYNYIIITFEKAVNNKENVKLALTFETTFKSQGEEDINLPFDIFGYKKDLKINVIRQIIKTDHVLKKHVANVKVIDGEDYALFNYFLLVNRKQADDLGKVIVKDWLENNTGDSAINVENIVFDKTSFVIEKGNFEPLEEVVIGGTVNTDKWVFKSSEVTESLDGGYSFDDGKIVLKFDDGEKPKEFTVTIDVDNKYGYKISYGVKVPKTEISAGYTISNSYTLTNEEGTENPNIITNEDGEPSVSRELEYTFKVEIIAEIAGRILVIKKDESGEAVEGARFKLVSGSKEYKGVTDEKGNLFFNRLPVGKEGSPIVYDVYEIKAPVDYEVVDSTKSLKTISLDIKKLNDVVKVKNTRKKINIKVNKVWAEGAPKEDVTFKLWRHILTEDKEEVKSIKLAKNSEHDFVEFKDLYEYDGKGHKYIYTVTEEPIDGYTSKVGELKPLEGNPTLYEVTVTNTKKPVAPPPSGGTTPPPPTPPAPSEDSKPEEPKQDPPKKEEPKKEEPKPQPPEEEPQPPADGIGGTGEPTPPTPDEPIERLIGGGAGSGTNETNVLPGMIPKITGGGTSAGDPNSAVDPGYVPMLPKTGEGLNASSYAVLIAVLGMAFVLYGIYRRKKC